MNIGKILPVEAAVILKHIPTVCTCCDAAGPYITATHDRNNPRSGNVMRKLGMTYRYSYEELWQPKNFPVIFRMYQLNLNGDNEFVYRKYWDEATNHFVEDL